MDPCSSLYVILIDISSHFVYHFLIAHEAPERPSKAFDVYAESSS